MDEEEIRSEVRRYYTRAAQLAATVTVTTKSGERAVTTAKPSPRTIESSRAVMGCGNPLAMIDLASGETGLYLGSGGGLQQPVAGGSI